MCRFRLIIFVGITVFFIPELFGQHKLSLENYFVKKSDLIVIGTVTNMTSKWDENKKNIYTYVTVKCIDCLKGKKLKVITIKVAGGIVGEVGIEITTAEKYTISEKIFAFLKKNSDGTYSVIAARDGKYTYKGANIINSHEMILHDHTFIDSINQMIVKQKSYSK